MVSPADRPTDRPWTLLAWAALLSLAACDLDRSLQAEDFACGLGGPCPTAMDSADEDPGDEPDGVDRPIWDGHLFGDLLAGTDWDGGVGPPDGGSVDSGLVDASLVDGAGLELPTADAHIKDMATPDKDMATQDKDMATQDKDMATQDKDMATQDAGADGGMVPDLPNSDAGPDVAEQDAGWIDAGVTDGDLKDGAPTDTGSEDASSNDDANNDAGPVDAGSLDAGEADTATTPQPCVADAAICDDGNGCTEDVCEPTKGCLHTPQAAKCATTCDPWAKCVAGACVSGQPTLFEKVLGGPGDYWGGDLVEQADGALVVVGHSAAKGAKPNVMRMNLSAKGFLKGMTTWAGAGRVVAMVALTDGTSILAGDNDHDGDGVWRGALSKMSAGGGPMWQKFYSGPGDGHFADVVALSDGAIVAVGQVAGGAALGTQGWLVRVVGFGSVVHSLKLGGAGEDALHGAVEDGNATVAVGARAAGAGLDGWLVRLDAKGKIAWQSYVAGPGKRIARQVASRPDGGWVVAGQHEVGGSAGWDGWLLATNGAGKVQWLRPYNLAGSQLPWALAPAGDGGWVLGGTDVSPQGDSDGWILRVDANGNALWQRRYGGPGTQRGFALQVLAGHGIALLGVRLLQNNEADVWLTRTDPWGEVDCGKSGACAFKGVASCDDGQPCTADVCTMGSCGHPPLLDGSPCADGKTCAATFCK